MCLTTGSSRTTRTLLGLTLLFTTSAALGQIGPYGFITGPAAEAWEKWDAAMKAVLDQNTAAAEQAFGELLALDPSPFRVALLADHTVNRTAGSGAVLLFEQDYEAQKLGPNGSEIGSRLMIGREQMNQADDGWYFCNIGRFDVADANFKALLAAGPDPVALLEFADRDQRRHAILLLVSDNPTVGEAAHAVMRLLAAGELAIKADPTRIKENIDRLDRGPRAWENALAALRDSGEYAVPFIVQYLRDRERHAMMQPILRALPLIDRPALNPLVIALRMTDQATNAHLIDAVGQIGYWQSVPYLLQVYHDPHAPEAVRQRVVGALASIRAAGVRVDPEMSPADAFLTLAELYYVDTPSLAADPRLETANVWYWRDDLLQNIAVPTEIFNEIMCMRCCEEALRHEPSLKPALALWLAANFRREAQLPAGQTDDTRPENYPSAAYFAQSAGADYCLMALARANEDGDPAVALGAIQALRQTAGPASLVSPGGDRLPLAEALSFPDRMVRVRAGLTMGHANPTQPFHNDQNLMPVLAEALLLHGGARNALVVDPNAEAGNEVAGLLRAQGYDVMTDASLFAGLEKIRRDFPGVDVIVIASDIAEPNLAAGLQSLRAEFRFASTPVIIVRKPGDAEMVRQLTHGDHRVAAVADRPAPLDLARAVAAVMRAVGAQPITADVGAALALESAQVLRELAKVENPLFDVAEAQTALLAALQSQHDDLRATVADVLGYLGSAAAQEAIARIALDETEEETMRVTMYTALAAAAKRRGNLLPDDLVEAVVRHAESDANMTLREAASRALGALNVPGEPASVIIRNQYRG